MIFTLKNWAAWAPAIATREDWKDWSLNTFVPTIESKPKLPFIPAIRRRRLSKLGAMIMQVIFSLGDDLDLSEVNTVFSSHHGELDTTLKLIDFLIENELFSPQKFSHSVHNTNSGLFSIELKNTNPSTALSAGEASFCYGILESMIMQSRYPEKTTLLAIGDESLPECFKPYRKLPEFSYAAAFLIKAGKEDGLTLKLTFKPKEQGGDLTHETPRFPQSLMFVHWMLSDEQHLTLVHKKQCWIWEKL